MEVLCQTFGVTVVPFSFTELPQWMLQHHRIHAQRWLFFLHYLRSIPVSESDGRPPYDWLLFSDARDVVFQRDPFMTVQRQGSGPGLYVAMEVQHATIGGCRFNSGWVRDQYGDVVLHQLQDASISCSGTTMGSWHSAMVYLEHLTHELSTRDGRSMFGTDQGVCVACCVCCS
jgi:hypothetical protein